MKVKPLVLAVLVFLTIAIVVSQTMTLSAPVSKPFQDNDCDISFGLIKPCGDPIETPGPTPTGQNKT